VARDLSLADHVRNVAGTPDAGDAPFLGLPGLYAKAAGLLPALFVAPAQGANGAAFFSQSVPTTMSAGQTYNVSVTMTNTGQTTWSAANSHRLGSQTPTDNTVWRLSRVQLPTSVLPGEKVTIPFTVTAPTVAKSYTFQWRMVQDGVEWFGQATAPVAVTVNAPDFEGEFESASCSEIKGWAWDLRRPNTPVEVDVFKVESGNEIFLARVPADQYRPSLGRGDNRHGFSLPAPAAIRDGGGPHSIRVRYANTSFQSPAPAELSGSTREVTGCAALPNATAPPASLVTWHASNTLIRLSWTPAAGATRYRVERATVKSGPFQFAGVASGTGYDDTGRTQGVAYLYRVCSSDSSGGACVSPYSNVALGTAFSFTDPTLQAGVTPVRKEHVNELRQTVDSVRAAAELNAASWGAPVAGADPIRAAHIRDLRARLAEALAALDILPPAYTDPTLFEQVTVVKRAHVEDLRLRSTLASGTVSGQPAQQASTVAPAARLEPRNRTGVGGVDLLSGNFNWSLPLVSLRGRAGLDLGLALSYNSLVWTRQGAAVHFNADEGYPAPGFRLGFPVIQPQYYNVGRGTNAYMLVTPGGSRVELRQTPEGHYESADSSHLKLYAFGGGLMQLRTTDGTLITFMARGHSHYVWEIRDRNGNRLSANHDSQGRLLSVTDTLARVINFNYDANHNLLSITQQRNGQQHAWATFGYGAAAVGAGAFGPAVTLSGAEAGRPVNVLTRVGLADGSGYRFEYNGHAQVRKISRRSADDHELAYTAYDYEPAADDCPRVAAAR
ncbi:MAG TPA: NBR1-Ig-like domain-containing protein, partial [Pyrinomonadaceae bacterium]